jgi:hypothetical protein
VKYRKKPVVVEAVRWTGDNEAELTAFTSGWFEAVGPEDRGDDPAITGSVFDVLHSTWVGVKTGQCVIRGVKGEYYPIDEEVLAETYEPAERASMTGPEHYAEGERLLAAASGAVDAPLLTAQARAHFAAAQTALLAAALLPDSVSWQTAIGLRGQGEESPA